MEYVPIWWDRIGLGTQAWLANNRHNGIPPEVADQIEAAGGRLFDAQWVAANDESWPVRFLFPRDQLWIETQVRRG
jgi:hypothetical protein